MGTRINVASFVIGLTALGSTANAQNRTVSMANQQPIVIASTVPFTAAVSAGPLTVNPPPPPPPPVCNLGWARDWRDARVSAEVCSARVAFAIQAITGSAPVVTRVNTYPELYQIRGFTGDAAIFATCTPARPMVSGGCASNLNLLVFSCVGSNHAAVVVDQVSTRFGFPSFC